VLPAVNVVTGLLPESDEPYSVTLEEIHATFVAGAPHFRDERQLVFDALCLYARLIWAIVPRASLRVDGGFITHKAWAPPADVDIAVVMNGVTQDQLDRALEAPLFTLLSVSGEVVGSRVSLAKSHVMGGLVDAFPILPNLPVADEFFRELWSSVTDADKKVVAGLKKGYVEVVNPDVA
jgi:hypothetical protein